MQGPESECIISVESGDEEETMRFVVALALVAILDFAVSNEFL